MKQLLYLLGYYAVSACCFDVNWDENPLHNKKKFPEEAWFENDICFEMNIPQKYNESCPQTKGRTGFEWQTLQHYLKASTVRFNSPSQKLSHATCVSSLLSDSKHSANYL